MTTIIMTIIMTIIVSMMRTIETTLSTMIRAPWWAAASAAVGLFLYQTLDAIDGKQAR